MTVWGTVIGAGPFPGSELERNLVNTIKNKRLTVLLIEHHDMVEVGELCPPGREHRQDGVGPIAGDATHQDQQLHVEISVLCGVEQTHQALFNVCSPEIDSFLYCFLIL